MYLTHLLNPLTGNCRNAITNDEFLMKEFVNQVNQSRSAITPGLCDCIIKSRVDECFLLDVLHVYRSPVDRNCEVIATLIMVEHFKAVANEIMYRSFPTNQLIELFERAYKPNRRSRRHSIDAMQIWQSLSNIVVKEKIDYVKLSTNIPFFAKEIGGLP